MSTTAYPRNDQIAKQPAVVAFGVCVVAFIVATAVVAGFLPIEFSIISVYLAAGPHNWVEARYFLSRLPARWGRLGGFFLVGFLGVAMLSVGFATLPILLDRFDIGGEIASACYATWNTLLTLWIATLVQMRSGQNPRRDWAWIWPVAFLIIALAWWSPGLWGLGLVYLHPLVALWILDREILRTRPEYRRLYHVCLFAIPICLLLLWWRLVGAPDLAGEDLLTLQIAQHAGSDWLHGISSHCLVATHTFLEAVHYGVWLIAIPWLGRQTNLWNIANTPLGRRSLTWTHFLQIGLAVSAGAVIVLWLCFFANYPVTRNVYFTVALVHVLAEVPFLLRAL